MSIYFYCLIGKLCDSKTVTTCGLRMVLLDKEDDYCFPALLAKLVY